LIVSSSLSLLIIGVELHPRLTVMAEYRRVKFYHRLCAGLCGELHNSGISRLAALGVAGWIIEYCRAPDSGASQRFFKDTAHHVDG
jgi:hypothetical protein